MDWPKRRATTIPPKSPLTAVTSVLVAHGCVNITSELDKWSISIYPVQAGGFGDIYKGRMKNGVDVAIKCARHRVEVEEAARELKFIAREIHAWSKCDHENVLAMFGLFEHHGRLATVSPWIENGILPECVLKNPLAHRLELLPKDWLIFMGRTWYVFSVREKAVLILVIQGSWGFERRLTISLAKANVLVSGNGIPKLADFGNTKMKEQRLRFSTRTTAVISLRWAAPELLEQSRASLQADVYALGMTIYETVTGRVPYADKTDMAVVMEVMINKSLPASDWDNRIVQAHDEEQFKSLLYPCWRRDASTRPRAAEIEHQGEGVSFGEFCKRNPWGEMRQMQCYNETDIPGNSYILVEVETTGIIIGIDYVWLRLRWSQMTGIDGMGHVKVSARQGDLRTGSSFRLEGRLLANDSLVDVALLKSLLNIWDLNPRVVQCKEKTFCQVVFDCMKQFFSPVDLVAHDGIVDENDGLSQPLRQEIRTQILGKLNIK
ncbi:hypothetical protein FRC12_014154 [Ceratobasidium sp. 428]|nr:hypothetical protein FRC12_014154 [Ceratobasidium sp. 428]